MEGETRRVCRIPMGPARSKTPSRRGRALLLQRAFQPHYTVPQTQVLGVATPTATLRPGKQTWEERDTCTVYRTVPNACDLTPGIPLAESDASFLPVRKCKGETSTRSCPEVQRSGSPLWRAPCDSPHKETNPRGSSLYGDTPAAPDSQRPACDRVPAGPQRSPAPTSDLLLAATEAREARGSVSLLSSLPTTLACATCCPLSSRPSTLSCVRKTRASGRD